MQLMLNPTYRKYFPTFVCVCMCLCYHCERKSISCKLVCLFFIWIVHFCRCIIFRLKIITSPFKMQTYAKTKAEIAHNFSGKAKKEDEVRQSKCDLIYNMA